MMRRPRRLIVVLGAVALAAAVSGIAAGAGSERANRRAAQRDAARLLAHVVLPASAVRAAAEPAGDRHDLARPGQVPAAVNR